VGGLRFEVLGPVRAWRGDGVTEEIELGPPQQRAVLAILLSQGGTPVSPDQLVAAVWGGAAPAGAIGMVRSYVSRLRRVLDAGVIESVGGGYAVRGPNLDVAEFERLAGVARDARRSGDWTAAIDALRRALGLWHGTPLAGVPGDHAEAERTRLGQARLAAMEDLAAAEIEAGRHAEAIGELTEVIAEHPFQERPRELLMLALYRSGRQAEALAEFTRVRRLLDAELGLEPGPDLRDLQRRILAADPALHGPPAAHGASHLPPDVPGFVGRAAALARLVDALTPSGATVPVVGIDGLAGIGKTTLAARVGHAVAAAFPDGQLFVDLGNAEDPLIELLRGAGVTEPPLSARERVTVWRSMTSGRRLLVVLDDARDVEQVRPLLPATAGSAVVITARQRLYGLAYTHWLTLEGLSEDESVALLTTLVGADRVAREPDAARELARRTAGLPQVVRALGARIAARPSWGLASALRRLGRPYPGAPVEPPECGAIEQPYESAMARLSPAQARAFRLLALGDGPDVSVRDAAAVLGLPPVDAAALLESLVDVHLLEPAEDDRYRYQEPLRMFARDRAAVLDGPEATQAALTRLVRAHSNAAGTAMLT